MVVEVTEDKFEDRIILVRAASGKEAHAKGLAFGDAYEKDSSWAVRKIVDAHEVLDPELRDGVEVYSSFVGPEFADALMKGGNSPAAEWKRQNPGKDPGDATVGEIIDAWDQRPTDD